ncbi:hypothetical protein Ahy_A03g012914 [Arachis hypogaea]|uniref:Putative plant transposon protein domain-containing protein n=1 Tax=Arachis hypogaea TaxID=3818 RepID=A0A445DUI3_ARAHY|nr:hypothetical protein Ahy_A03g012914 [Arachis hypogaea]
MSSKDVVPELPFKLKKDEYPEIQKIIRKRGWELLCDQPQEISMLLIHEFFTNVIREYDDEEPYMSYVRGVDVDFSPDTINRVLRVKHKQFKRPSYEERVENDPRYVDVDSWLGYPSTILRLCEEAGVPLGEFEETDLVSIGKPLTKERLEFITTTQLERQPLARRKKRKEVRQEEEPQEMDESHTLNMNQLQAALEGISGQYSQIQRSQEEQVQQQRDLWQLMDQQREVQVQWMNQQNEYQAHMMELQQEQYAKMQEAINNSAMEHEKAMEKVIQEQAQLRMEQAQQRELLHRLDARHETLYRDFNENRMFKEARHKDRLDYDICTQEKLSYLCSTPPLINPQIKCFNEARKIFEQQELARTLKLFPLLMIGDETRKHGSKNDASWARSWRCQLGIGVANSTTQGKLGPGGNQGKKLALPTWDWRCQRHTQSYQASLATLEARLALPTLEPSCQRHTQATSKQT